MKTKFEMIAIGPRKMDTILRTQYTLCTHVKVENNQNNSLFCKFVILSQNEDAGE